VIIAFDLVLFIAGIGSAVEFASNLAYAGSYTSATHRVLILVFDGAATLFCFGLIALDTLGSRL
jgi:hypothetical protein